MPLFNYGDTQNYVPFGLFNAATDVAITGASPTVEIAFGSDALAAGAGTLHELGGGAYSYQMDGSECLSRKSGVLKISGTAAKNQVIFLDERGSDRLATDIWQYDPSFGGPLMKELFIWIMAALVGKSSGGGTASRVFRDMTDSFDAITATVDANNNRTGVALSNGD